LDQILTLGELRVVTRSSPLTFYAGTDEPRGIEYELARGFAASLGVDLKISVESRFSELLPDVGRGKAHIAAAALTVTGPRKELVSFGPAYESVEQEVVFRRGAKPPQSVDDLVGARIEVIAGSAHAALLEKAREMHPGLAWREDPLATSEELVRRVSEGIIDYTIVPSNAFALLQHSYPDVQAAFAVGGKESVAWAVPKGAERLREKVAAYFAKIKATGELDRIIDRYYFASRDFDYVGSRAFLRHIESRLPNYRPYFEEAQRETGIDWRLLAAISYQESHWDPSAVSPTGVRGMMMLTDKTAGMMQVANRENARESILGGARYFKKVLAKIPARIPNPDRIWLAVAAYNVGFGHLEDARILTEMQGANPDRWDEVRKRLPLLGKKAWYSRVKYGYARGREPMEYTDNVRRYYGLLTWMADREALTEYMQPAQRSADASAATG
jgi:membrane-bound lytic murein transglycosylase F